MKYGYARVSTDHQNLEMQVEALNKAGCEKVFSEAITGVAKTKPQFERMMAELRRGDIVTVYAFSRVSRSLQDLLNILDRFRLIGVEVKSLTEPIDTTSPMGKAFFQMIGVFAELEREILVQRVQEGSRLARQRGQGGGRKPILTDKEVLRLKQLHAEKKLSIPELCKRFGISKTALYKYLNK